VDPRILRKHARDCEQMARECTDVFTREALRELAAEFMKAADALETRTPDPKPQRKRAGRSAVRSLDRRGRARNEYADSDAAGRRRSSSR
jgi:hypothetical protein